MRKNVAEVTEAALIHNRCNKSNTIHTDGYNIYSYSALIAKHCRDGSWIVTEEKFSKTTTCHVNGVIGSLVAAGKNVRRVTTLKDDLYLG